MAATQQIATIEEQAAPAPVASHSEPVSMLAMIERAARDPNVDIDKLERLMGMSERLTAQRASAAFAAAFAAMQDELPSIAERGKGHGTVTYALWEDINDAIKPVLARHGFGLRFEVGRAGDRLTVTGVLMHREGHSERTMMELPADTSGSKNAVQAVGSSTSYGKRYVASALLNLTSRLKEDRDDDGQAGGGVAFITEEQAIELRELMESVGADETRFLKHLRIPKLMDLPAARFDGAVRDLQAKGARR